jgi:hypothetical protein
LTAGYVGGEKRGGETWEKGRSWKQKEVDWNIIGVNLGQVKMP